MADSDIKLKATLDAAEVQQGLQAIGREATSAIDTAGRSASKMAENLEKVGSASKISAQQITSMAVAMSGMAMRLGASVMESRGMSTGARYLEGAGQMAMTGAAAMAPLGPQAAVVGALGGAAIGGIKTYFDLESEENAKEDARQKSVLANAEMVDQFDRLRQAADESSEFIARMGDETLSASERQAQLTGRMAEFAAAAEDLRAKLKTEEVLEDGKKFAETMKEYGRVMGEMSKMRGVDLKDVAAKTSTGPSALSGDYDALQRLGITVGGAGGMAGTLGSLVERSNRYLELIERHLREDGIEPQARYA